MKMNVPQQITPINAAKRIVLIILKEYFEFLKEPLILDDELKRVLNLLTLYFAGNSEFEKYYLETKSGKKLNYSLKKGILLIGSSGRCKTICFETVFKTFTQHFNPVNAYKITNAFKLEKIAHTDGLVGLMDFAAFLNENYTITGKSQYSHLYIDEVGIENKEIQKWGNSLKPFETLLHLREDEFKKGAKTHFTTNYNLSELKNIYSSRTYSRFFRMFNIIITSGEDLGIK